MFRTLAIAAVVPVGLLGMMGGVTQICARWPEYVAYRIAGTPDGFRWRNTPLRLIQLALLPLCLGAMARAGVDVFTWLSAALLSWSLLLARKDIWIALQSAHRLDRMGKKDPQHEDHRHQGLGDRPSPEGGPL